MIQSVFVGDDANVVDDLLSTHARGPRVLDMTYGHGGFWRNARALEHAVTGLDKRAGTDAIDRERKPANVTTLVAGDFTALPFANASFDVVAFDPPFMTHPGNGSVMVDRYTAYATYEELLASCAGARDEARRVLKPRGVAIVKCMDWVEGRTRWRWLHYDLMRSWTSTSRLRLIDLVVNVRPTSLRHGDVHRQAHAKRAHTYFLVFGVVQRRRSRSGALGSEPGTLRSRDHEYSARSRSSGSGALQGAML